MTTKKLESSFDEAVPHERIRYASNIIHHTSYFIPYTLRRTPYTLYLIPLTLLLFLLSACHVYSFNNATIPPEVKTIKIGFIENKARYVNPQLSPRLTDRIQQKISNQTRLTRTNNDDADWIVNGTITQDEVTTAGISNQQAATNRLTITVHITFKDNLKNTTQEFDATRNFDFNASRSREEAQASLLEEILRNLSDEIFNHLFSNW